jgi:hypothetical protein
MIRDPIDELAPEDRDGASAFTAGSVFDTVRTIDAGRSTAIGVPWWVATVACPPSTRKFAASPTIDRATWSCS